MALGLKDLRELKSPKKRPPQWEDPTGVVSKTFREKQEKNHKKSHEKMARPWESFDDILRTRTFGAMQAVDKAREIVARNELMSIRLHSFKNNTSEETVIVTDAFKDYWGHVEGVSEVESEPITEAEREVGGIRKLFRPSKSLIALFRFFFS